MEKPVSKSVKVLIGLLIVIPVVAHVAYNLWRGPLTGYYLTVDEALARTSSPAAMRVAGRVVPGSLDFYCPLLPFTLSGESQTLSVVYPGPAPNLLGPGRTAIVEGRLGADGVFVASYILLKCPHSYVKA